MKYDIYIVAKEDLPLFADGTAFYVSLQHNFLLRLNSSIKGPIGRRSNLNISQRSIIINLRLSWSFLCSRVFFSMIPFLRCETLKIRLLIVAV